MARARGHRTGVTTTIRIRRHAPAALLAGGLIVLTACNGSSSGSDAAPKKPPKTSTPSQSAATPPSPTSDPRAPIAAAYQKYWDEKVAAYAQASVQGTELKKYAVAEAYSQAATEVKALKTKGLVATGKPVLAPKVTSVDTERKVPQGSLTDCTDVSQWKLVKQSSGQEVTLPDKRLTKYVTKVVAEKWYGRWVIVRVTPEDRTC
uniref:Secreted protein/lipoprotein n=1 Tax=Streptomyces sp. NBC_00180 TaxID=2903632 RepID=A0AAU1IAP9_9ACTN